MNIIERILHKDDSWVTDNFKTPKPYIGAVFIPVYYSGNMLSEKLAIKITSVLHPEYVYDSPEFYKFLGTNPWEFTVVRALWLVVLCAIMYFVGIRFFHRCKKSDKNMLKWFTFGLVSIIALQGISIWMTKMNGSMTANQELLNKQLVATDWARKIVVFMMIPAFGEELMMRGVVQRYIFPKLPYIGILMSAFLFQGMHYTTKLSDAMLYFVSGLVWIGYTK